MQKKLKSLKLGVFTPREFQYFWGNGHNFYWTQCGVKIEANEGKPTTGGHLGIAVFCVDDRKVDIKIEVSLRRGKHLAGNRAVIQSDYSSPYSLVHLPMEDIIQGKPDALMATMDLLKKSKIDFRSEIKMLLPKSHAMRLRDFKKILEQKILSFELK